MIRLSVIWGVARLRRIVLTIAMLSLVPVGSAAMSRESSSNASVFDSVTEIDKNDQAEGL